MYSMMAIMEELDTCEESLADLKKGKRSKMNMDDRRQLSVSLLKIKKKIQSNLKEYNKSLTELKSTFFDNIRRKIINKKIAVLEECLYQANQMNDELQKYMPKAPR